MKEQLECLEENLQAKREELEEKTQLLESSQERVMELSSELAMLKSTPEDTSKLYLYNIEIRANQSDNFCKVNELL